MRTLFFSLVLLTPIPLQAALVATESFETYSAGAQVESNAGVGLSGGTGWSGAWNVTDALRSQVTIVSQTLSYSQGDVVVSGGSLAMQILAANSDTLAIRAIPSQSTVFYYSFLFNTPTGGGANQDFTQLGFDSSAANPRVSVGHNVNTGLDPDDHDFFARVTTSSSDFTDAPTTLGQTYFLVARVSKEGGSTNWNRTTLWVNPTTQLESAAPSALINGNAGMDVVSTFVIRTAGLETGDVSLIDELRVGTTFADVVPVPEPGALALCGMLAALGMVLVRRRRTAAQRVHG